MKYLIFLAFLLLLSCDCGKTEETKDYDVIKTSKVVGKSTTSVKSVVPPTETGFCRIGGSYVFCNYTNDDPNINDPFEPISRFTVIIVDMKDGWVQYQHDEDIGVEGTHFFTNTIEDFEKTVNSCK